MNEQIGTITEQAPQINITEGSDFPLLEPHMTRDGLMVELRRMGFSNCSTASGKWITAFYFTHKQKTLFILFRRNGIDILLTSAQFSDLLNSDEKLCINSQNEGNEFAEYHYVGSHINIHSRILRIAHLHIDGRELDATFFCSIGMGKNGIRNNNGGDSSHKYRISSEGSRSELYDAVSHGDGEPVYFGDGMWINSDGSMDDRGR